MWGRDIQAYLNNADVFNWEIVEVGWSFRFCQLLQAITKNKSILEYKSVQ